MRSTLAALMLVAFMQHAAPAQVLGLVRLSLGQPRADVLAALSRYLVEQSPSSDVGEIWNVSDTTLWHGVTNIGNIGHVQFRGGLLVGVNREWPDSGTDAITAVSQILSVLHQADNQTACTTSTQRWDTPESRGDYFLIECGSHLISVGRFDQGGKPQWGVSESWVMRAQKP